MDNLFQMPADSELTNFANPFTLKGMSSGGISWAVFGKEIRWTGFISFTVGDTTGLQQFKAKTLPDMIIQMEAFLKGLDKK